MQVVHLQFCMFGVRVLLTRCSEYSENACVLLYLPGSLNSLKETGTLYDAPEAAFNNDGIWYVSNSDYGLFMSRF